MSDSPSISYPLQDGTVYSRRKNCCPFCVPSLQEYEKVAGQESIERLVKVAGRIKGLKILELNATAQGGGVAEMLYSSMPMMNNLGIAAEWKVISGSKEYFECTKAIHNMLQGKEGVFTPEMQDTYCRTIADNASQDLIDFQPQVVMVHDPQPMGLQQYLQKPGQSWIWRCHIDIEEAALQANPGLRDFTANWLVHYNAAILSAAHYVITRWPLPKFIIPPFIDPLSEKNRELSQKEIDQVLAKYQINREAPIIAQVGRYDPWKGIDRTISAFRLARKERRCQLIIAGGQASDDPEGERILAHIYQITRHDKDIHILNLSLADRLENWKEVNAIQRAASIIMQPSIREGFGLVITEALWKGKPVIAADVGAIPLQIRDRDNGFFFQSPARTAKLLVHLLDNPEIASAMGLRGKGYVKEHFLLPDRLADMLMAMDIVSSGRLIREQDRECIISFHPWFKLSKREHPLRFR
jgi:trehalose synthase